MLDGNVVKCCAREKALDGEARDLIKLTLVHWLLSPQLEWMPVGLQVIFFNCFLDVFLDKKCVMLSCCVIAANTCCLKNITIFSGSEQICSEWLAELGSDEICSLAARTFGG